jgi:hypothetical protein
VCGEQLGVVPEEIFFHMEPSLLFTHFLGCHQGEYQLLTEHLPRPCGAHAVIPSLLERQIEKQAACCRGFVAANRSPIVDQLKGVSVEDQLGRELIEELARHRGSMVPIGELRMRESQR